ncbi:hypothetical protein [Tunturiibacter gelidiferens]|uniref:hypothetical protein n=1 Tax=Tunturiibacter gelidiferens TaxID=3069689 RepID=UPI003D9BD337
MAQWHSPSHKFLPVIQRYGFAAVSVILALLPGLLLQHYKFHDVELPLFSSRSLSPHGIEG